MATQINARLQALRIRPTVKYHPANPREGLALRQARQPFLSAADQANIKWANDVFKCDLLGGIHVAKLEPNVEATRASFFSAAAVPMRLSNAPFEILNSGVLNLHFTMPVYVVQDPRWYHGNFNPSIMSTTRYPAFDSASTTLSVNSRRRESGCSAVEIMEVYVAVLWQTLADTLQDRSSADRAVLVTRSAQIYLQEYANITRVDSKTAKAACISRLRGLLEKRDVSCADAGELTKFIATLHPADYYEAMLNNFEFFDASKMPAIFHLFLGMITRPDNVSIYGLREIVLQACIERCARHISSVRLTGASQRDIDACYNTVVGRAAEVLVPVLRKWCFVLDCLTLFCSPTFLHTPAQQVAKQVAAYADYAETYVRDGNLRAAMEAVYPGIAKISNTDVVEMLMRAAECSRKTRFNANELFHGNTTNTESTRFDQRRRKALEYDENIRRAAAHFVADLKTCADTAKVPLGGLPHFFSGSHAFDTTLLALDHFAEKGNREMFDAARAKTPFFCQEGKRFRAIWNFYNDGKKKDTSQMNYLVKRLRPLQIDNKDDPVSPTAIRNDREAEEKKENEEQPQEWMRMLESAINTGAGIKARELLVGRDNECCVCLDDLMKLVSCCIVSDKHKVCDKCLPTILAGRVCPLCRGDVR